MRKVLEMAVGMALAGLLAACEDKGNGGPDGPPGGGAQPNQVTGRALNTQGQPLAGAVIYVGGVDVAVTPRSSTTNADGRYVVDGFIEQFTYKAFGWLPMTYRGKDFCLRLAPEQASGYEPFLARDGAVRDFRWRLQGRMEDSTFNPNEDGAYYGGTLRIFPEFADDDYTGSIELQLTPTGPLIDGSQGQPLTRTVELSGLHYALDIPVGPYTVTAARIKPGGARTAARVGPDSSSAASESTLEFSPTFFGTCGSKTTSSGVDRAFLYVVSP